MATILLVDDDPSCVEIASIVCAGAGHEVIVARNGQDALYALVRQPVDLVLMDVVMPVLDGLEATRLIRQNPAFAALPVIGFTAVGDLDTRMKMEQVGMCGVVRKPYRNGQLVAAIAAALGSPELVKTVPQRVPTTSQVNA
ncbi:MAG: integral rane sensor hybrid histidine kinase [Cyanobacteria bacterium RYN_339]|nr:integral rane sensor hybrid histidine kinase [Cyanobacteria bacterium RYN_339]